MRYPPVSSNMTSWKNIYKWKFIDGKKHPFVYKGIFFQQAMFE